MLKKQERWKGHEQALIITIWKETKQTEELAEARYRSPTWAVIWALWQINRATRIEGEAVMSAPYFFQSVGWEYQLMLLLLFRKNCRVTLLEALFSTFLGGKWRTNGSTAYCIWSVRVIQSDLPSQSHWSLFNGTWQKRLKELDNWLRFELKKWHSKCNRL